LTQRVHVGALTGFSSADCNAAEKGLGEELKMELRHTWALVLAATLICASCAANGGDSSATHPSNPPVLERPLASPAMTPKLPIGADPVNLNPADFSANITNQYWPMKPGTRWIYRNVERGNPPQDIAVVVTTATKNLANGVTARIVRDTGRSNGQIVEDTMDYYAQDAQGNVWYMGEQTAEFENGKVVSREGSWEAGKDGAMPGIMIPAKPQVGQKYRQEYKKGEAEDNGEVLGLGQLVQVKTGLYKQALVTMDTSNVEKTAVEYKFYAPRVGPLLALDVSGGASREELIKIDKAPGTAGTGPIGKPNPSSG
jgi:hypothetical protein